MNNFILSIFFINQPIVKTSMEKNDDNPAWHPASHLRQNDPRNVKLKQTAVDLSQIYCLTNDIVN